MVRHSLVGYDGSESARRAFRFALELARCGGGRVRVVRAVQRPVSDPAALAAMMLDAGDETAAALARELAGLAPGAEDLFDAVVIGGSPGDVLLAQVEAHAVDHICIGHTERGALARWLVGSVSTEVLARARVPVTIVR